MAVPHRPRERNCVRHSTFGRQDQTHTFQGLGDATESERHARLSIDHARAQKRARRGAMSHAALAVSHLQRRDLEAAHAAGLRTLTLTSQVKSSCAIEAVQNLKQQMVPFGRHALVADFNDRARELLSA
nr:hypothetical protein [Streptomyces sp. NRRL S-350]